MLDTEVEGNYVAARPSGTEPKVKFYMFTYVPPTELKDLEATKKQMAQRMKDYEADLRKFADTV